MSGSTDDALQSMASLSTVADETGGASQSVLVAADEVRRQAVTLRNEVDHFLAAARSAGNERRSYARTQGGGTAGVLRWHGITSAPPRMEIIDMSCSGAALRGEVPLGCDAEIECELPGADRPLRGRVIRVTDGRTAVTFRQDPGMIALAERALATLPARAAAA